MAETTVGDIMHKGVIACKPDTPLQEVVRIVADTDVHAIVVVDSQGEVRGIISHFDLIKCYGTDLQNRKAQDIMTPEVVDIAPTVPVSEAVQLMVEHDIHRLLVTEMTPTGKRPVGVLSTTDVVKDMRGARWVWYMG
ncbi:MAG: CBS domain-containing protein [Anaerolineae bacterium]|jgi:CBS domain-containing protein|nr:CBS domain-containing protein [Anaerolineae bacterium]MDH7473176.1 CBS domain-containing protein [Anaerolineae bacterium]